MEMAKGGIIEKCEMPDFDPGIHVAAMPALPKNGALAIKITEIDGPPELVDLLSNILRRKQ